MVSRYLESACDDIEESANPQEFPVILAHFLDQEFTTQNGFNFPKGHNLCLKDIAPNTGNDTLPGVLNRDICFRILMQLWADESTALI